MPYSRPSLTALQSQALADIAAALPTGQPLPASVLRVLATSQAGLVNGNYGYQDWIARQSVPFTATGEHMEAWAALKGVTRKLATAARGTATLTGTAGAAIPAGTVLQRGDGLRYATDADALVSAAGLAFVPFTAADPGAAGNAAANTALSLSNPLAGVASAATAALAITGGADDEDDASLRSRMLARYAAPPQGGSEADYVQWAREVPGVTRAWCRATGSGQVSVYFCMDAAQASNNGIPQGSNGGAALETRLAPATGDMLAVANYIHPRRTATALVSAVAPIPQYVNVTLANLSPNTAAVQTAIQLSLQDTFRRIGSPLGMTVYASDIAAAVEGVPGVDRFTIVTPTSPVAILTGRIPQLGVFGATG